MDEEYFLRNGPETSAWHAAQICNASLADLPLVAIRYRQEINAQQILVVAPESYLLLMRSTAAIDSLGLSIMDARVHLTRSGMSILVFIVSAEEAVADTTMAQQTSTLRDFLLNPPAKYRPISRNLPRVMKQFQVPTAVSFADNEQLGHTTMEVVSQDRPGLLYLVSVALVECRIKLKSAKISTVGEKAEDTFLITDRDGNPVSDPAQKKRLETLIKSYLEQND